MPTGRGRASRRTSTTELRRCTTSKITCVNTNLRTRLVYCDAIRVERRGDAARFGDLARFGDAARFERRGDAVDAVASSSSEYDANCENSPLHRATKAAIPKHAGTK